MNTRRSSDDTTRHDGELGFSLIELMTVVMIVAVLIAILIPNFLQAKKPAMDRQAQSLLRESATAARTVESSAAEVAPTASALASTEPGVDFVDATTSATAKMNRVSVSEGTSGGAWYLILASHSTSGRCYAVLERDGAATAFQRMESASCRADQFDPGTGWVGSW
ncbi:MAG: prepilin-type N-terminal cleavage/methylation domain-containing protein [Actinobacteria bacterium]|nr:prepilin-type N-terminal cleavage/methylation domain-containing protein [Actinomycetota bacterium]